MRLPELVAFCVSVSEFAGSVIRSVERTGNLSVVNKNLDPNGILDPQTAADRASQYVIKHYLSSEYPKLTVIGEEEDESIGKMSLNLEKISSCSDVLNRCKSFSCEEVDESDYVLWVDPLDGTSDFTAGLRKHVTVLIGVANRNGDPVAGVMHQPFFINKSGDIPGRTVWGIVGIGAFNLMKHNRVDPDKLIVATSRLHVTDKLLEMIKSINPDKIKHCSGAGYKALLVMENKVDAFFYPCSGTCKWDICASDAIFRSMTPKYVLSDMNGKPYKYGVGEHKINTRGFLACEGSLHSTLINKIPIDYRKMFE